MSDALFPACIKCASLQMPFVIRKEGESHCLVYMAYIYGMMDGELWNTDREGIGSGSQSPFHSAQYSIKFLISPGWSTIIKHGVASSVKYVTYGCIRAVTIDHPPILTSPWFMLTLF